MATTGILPDEVNAGAVQVRDIDGVCLNPANVVNAYCPPGTFASTCAITALPSGCDARIEPGQVNAIVSELLAFAECLHPDGTWSCESLQNICVAFNAWVAKNGNQVIISADPPPDPLDGQLWFDTDTGILYAWSPGTGPGGADEWLLVASPPIEGPRGPQGVNAYTQTVAGFVVPDVGSSVDVDFVDASWVVVGQMLWIAGAGENGAAGQLQATAKTGNTVKLYNPPLTAAVTGGWAPLDSPLFTGTPQAPTPPAGDYDQSLATTQFVTDMVAASGGLGGGFTTGDAKFTYKKVSEPGWILLNDGSIGDANSSGTTRANADTQALFKLFWDNIPELIVQTNTGTTVARGPNALNDFNLHRRLVLPKALGRALACAGNGAGLGAHLLGAVTGAETETPTLAKTANHNHPDRGHNHGTPHGSRVADLTGVSYTVLTVEPPNVTLFGNTGYADVGPVGSGNPLNIMQPTTYLNVMVKL